MEEQFSLFDPPAKDVFHPERSSLVQLPEHFASMTLAQAREWLLDRIMDGASCPCCGQMAKIYARSIYAKMAVHLIKLYRLTKLHQDRQFFHVTEFVDTIGNDTVKTVHWDLIEEMPKTKDMKSKKTSGFWRLTEKGKLFVENKIQLPEKALIYNANFLGFEEGKMVSIIDCLGEGFDYYRLMEA